MSHELNEIIQDASVSGPPDQRKVRLLLWGGAAKPGDNSAFGFAARNVSKDYKALDGAKFLITSQRVLVAKDIVKIINESEDDSIQSLDVFTHGGPEALYLTTANPDTEKVSRRFLHNCSLYRHRARLIFNWAAWTGGAALVRDIDFNKFTTNAKIELHGCKSADTNSNSDNMAGELSIRLYAVGKLRAVVIGHAEGANPNIKGGGEKLAEQDYRHGQRVVLHNGKIVKMTRQKGHLGERELELLVG